MNAISDCATEAMAYLNLAKFQLSNDNAIWKLLLPEIGGWIESQLLGDDCASETFLLRIATLLRFKPLCLHGFNTLLGPSYRLEFSDTVDEVTFFVLIKGNSARILSTAAVDIPNPSTTDQLRTIIISQSSWEFLLERGSDRTWLICISQLLQVILDDTSTHPLCRRRAYRCLRELARKSILPPTIFINNLRRGTGHAVQGGAFADIYKGTMGGNPVCFRVLRMFETPLEERELLYKDFCSEVLVWRQLKHPNILPFIGASIDLFSPQFCFVTPWLRNGDIISYLKQKPDHDRFTSICEVVEGIEYLHGLDPPVTHKDIKGANVLVRDDLVCCLADFGLASIVESQRLGRVSPAFEGSVCWAAPEIINPPPSGVKNAKSVDIYALGCTIYEIYTGKPPFVTTHKSAVTIMFAVLSGQRPLLPPPGCWSSGEEQLWWLVGLCWKAKPEERPEMHLIKQSLQDIATRKFQKAITPFALQLESKGTLVDLVAVQKWLRKESSFQSTPSINSNHTGYSPQDSAPGQNANPFPVEPMRKADSDQGYVGLAENGVCQPITIQSVQHAKNNKPPNLSIIPPGPLSGHATLGLLTPNTPSMILGPIDLQESDVEVLSGFDDKVALPMQSTFLPSSLIVKETYLPPTPPSTPLPKSKAAQSVEASKVGAPPSLAARLIRIGKSVAGPRRQTWKPSSKGYVPSPLRPSL